MNEGFIGWVWPLAELAAGTRPVISDGFKATAVAGVHRQHLGVDLMYPRNPHGTPAPPQMTKGFFCLTGKAEVLAAGPGKVFSVNRADSHGIAVTVDHGQVAGVGPRLTVYRHLATCVLEKGAPVIGGTFLGFAGHDLAAGPTSPNHLHFELQDTSRPRSPGQGQRDAFAIDPEPAMRIWRVKTQSGFTSPDISPAGEDDSGEAPDSLASSVGYQTGLLADATVIHGIPHV